MMDAVTALGKTTLFGDLDRPALERLAERVVPRRYRKGNVIFVQGEQGERCFVIVSGAVKISAYHEDGREAVLAMMSPGDVFGELGLFERSPRSADATAVEDTEILSLDTAGLSAAIAEHPQIGLALLAVLGRRLRQANDALQDIQFFDVPGRVARRLADLAETHGVPADDGVEIDLALSQEGLAQMVGATRESVNKALAGLQRRGLVKRVGKRYVVADVAGLRSRAR
jgi:CRP/FNR family cyclic AMP-dependent transcriptional regulator